MNVLIVVPRNEESGLGHFHRMEALAGAVVSHGHRVAMLVLGPECHVVRRLGVAVNFCPITDIFQEWVGNILECSPMKPFDWVVLDFPESPRGLIKQIKDSRVCLVDGVGHESEEADLVVSQGYEGRYKAPDYLLLRPGLTSHRWTGPEGPTLVWGGGADPMGLVARFVEECPDEEAFILPPRFGPSAESKSFQMGKRHWVAHAEDDYSLFGMMATCGKAVVASGMILWELAALGGIPIYAFSKTERHLETAKGMEDAGLVLAWPEVGLPPPGALAKFVEIPFVPVGRRPDCLGPGRVVRLMEEILE